MRQALAWPMAVGLLLSGCSLAPQYERPAMPVPDAWNPETTAAAGPEATPLPDIPWQEFFTDPSLRSVVELAVANNRDLRAAALNVQRARAVFRIQRADLLPNVAATASGDIYRLPAALSDTGEARTIAQYQVGLGVAGWELDFFGRLQSLKAAALEQFFATQEARTATQISLVAAVATTYLDLGADSSSLELAEETLTAQEASLDLIRRSHDLGVADALALHQAESQVEAARVDVARLSGVVALDRNALTLLVGATVPAELLPEGLGKVTPDNVVVPELPSEVLLRRPDILAAEHRLEAANANIGAARAAFFPHISLTGSAGTLSSELSGLFAEGSGAWSFLPQITVPIFEGGALRAGLETAVVDRELAVAGYEKTIQTAFREVNDALALRQTLAEQQRAQQALVASLDKAYELSRARYKAGISSYLEVLVAQRSLYTAQQGLIAVRMGEEANLVNLFKVLGGGGGPATAEEGSPSGGA